MSLSNFILDYITERKTKSGKTKQINPLNPKQVARDQRRHPEKYVDQTSSNSNESKPKLDDVDRDLLRWKKSGGVKNFVQNGPRSSILKPSPLTSTSSSPTSSSTPLSSTPSSSPTSSFWSNTKSHLGNHKVAYGVGAGGLAAAGAGVAYLHHRNKNKGIINKIKNNPGKTAAGASLAALGAGAGVAALIRHLRKKKK